MLIFTFAASFDDCRDQGECSVEAPGLAEVCSSVCVAEVGDGGSEVRHLQFLPEEGSTVLALALRSLRSRGSCLQFFDVARNSAVAACGAAGVAGCSGSSGVLPASAAVQTAEGNSGCSRSREVNSIAWHKSGTYLAAAAENALLVDLRASHEACHQLPLRLFKNPKGRRSKKGASSSAANLGEDVEICCWAAAFAGDSALFAFSGGRRVCKRRSQPRCAKALP